MHEITWAPVYAAYGENNRTLMCRLPVNRRALELRTADSGVQLLPRHRADARRGARGHPRGARPGRAGQRGHVQDRWRTRPRRDSLHRLPRTLGEASTRSSATSSRGEVLGDEFHQTFVEYKRGEWETYNTIVDRVGARAVPAALVSAGERRGVPAASSSPDRRAGRHPARDRGRARHDRVDDPDVGTAARSRTSTPAASGGRSSTARSTRALPATWTTPSASSRAGEITVSNCHGHGCVGSVAGIYTASMPVFVVENRDLRQPRLLQLLRGRVAPAAQLRRVRRRGRGRAALHRAHARPDAARGRAAHAAASSCGRSSAARSTWATSCTAATPPRRRSS